MEIITECNKGQWTIMDIDTIDSVGKSKNALRWMSNIIRKNDEWMVIQTIVDDDSVGHSPRNSPTKNGTCFKARNGSSLLQWKTLKRSSSF